MNRVRLRNPAVGTVLVVVDDNGVIVGRCGGGAAVEVEGDARLSRRHGRLWRQGSAVWYEDVGSQNGSWVEDVRLQGPVELRPGVSVRLSETVISLDDETTPVEPPQGLPHGMDVRMHGHVGGEGLTRALTGSTDAGPYVAALYDIVDKLLRSTSRDLIPSALRRVREVVPAAHRMALAAWPPQSDGRLGHLLAVEGEPAPISSTLARWTIDKRQALLLSDVPLPDGLSVGPSVVNQGIRSAAYVPLLGPQEEALGVFIVDSPAATLPLTAQHFQFICAVGGLLATTLAAEKLEEEARRRQSEAQRVAAQREALAAFLKIASHDLKNPVGAISISARMLQEMRLPADKREKILDVIVRAGDQAISLIHSYLEVAEVESGHALRVERRAVDARALLDEELEILRLSLQERLGSITLENRVECGLVQADEQKLRQILSNLVSNAIKYSPRGGRVMVATEALDGEIQFHVSDQGVGVSAEEQQRLFTAFERVGDQRLAPGSGLGLWLSAALVAAHGGRMWVKSVPQEGSTFSFSLPACTPFPAPSG